MQTVRAAEERPVNQQRPLWRTRMGPLGQTTRQQTRPNVRKPRGGRYGWGNRTSWKVGIWVGAVKPNQRNNGQRDQLNGEQPVARPTGATATGH